MDSVSLFNKIRCRSRRSSPFVLSTILERVVAQMHIGEEFCPYRTSPMVVCLWR